MYGLAFEQAAGAEEHITMKLYKERLYCLALEFRTVLSSDDTLVQAATGSAQSPRAKAHFPQSSPRQISQILSDRRFLLQPKFCDNWCGRKYHIKTQLQGVTTVWSIGLLSKWPRLSLGPHFRS